MFHLRRVKKALRCILFNDVRETITPEDDVCGQTYNSDDDSQLPGGEVESMGNETERRPSYYPAGLNDEEVSGFMNMFGYGCPFSEEELKEWLEEEDLPDDLECDLASRR